MIRYLLRYLKVAYIDILLDEYEEQKKTLPPAVLNLLRSKSIKTNDLPAIIHNHEIVYELNQVMNYICITFNREDLLGVDLFQKVIKCRYRRMSAKFKNFTLLGWPIISDFYQDLSPIFTRLSSMGKICWPLLRKRLSISLESQDILGS